MIGHYLLTLDSVAEDRVLTTGMFPGDYGAPCLVGVAMGGQSATETSRARYCNRRWPIDWASYEPPAAASVEDRYDALCVRFGTPRVNNAIRNRVLANIACRDLRPVVRETAGVV